MVTTPTKKKTPSTNPLEIVKKQSIPAPTLKSNTGNDGTKQPEAATPPQVFRNETGRLSGVKMPDGRTFLGLSPEEVNKITEAERTKNLTPAGAVEVSDVSRQEKQTQQNVQLAQGVAQPPSQNPTNGEPPKIDLKQAGATGAAAAVPGVIGGALTGAIAGGVAGSVVPGVGNVAGAVGGAVVGGVGAFLAGARSNIKNQLSENIATTGMDLTQGQKNLRNLVRDTNANPSNAAENLELFNYQLALINQSHSKLKKETQSTLSTFTGEKGDAELAKYESFYASGGSRDFLVREMQVALLTPNPSKGQPSLEELQLDATNQ